MTISPSSQQQSGGGPDLTPLFEQVFAALKEMREDVKAMRVQLGNMVTREELSKYVTRESADGQRQLLEQRITEVSQRADRAIERGDQLQDKLHGRELEEAQFSMSERKELDARTITIMTTVISLVLSPLIWTIFTLIQHAFGH